MPSADAYGGDATASGSVSLPVSGAPLVYDLKGQARQRRSAAASGGAQGAAGAKRQSTSSITCEEQTGPRQLDLDLRFDQSRVAGAAIVAGSTAGIVHARRRPDLQSRRHDRRGRSAGDRPGVRRAGARIGTVRGTPGRARRGRRDHHRAFPAASRSTTFRRPHAWISSPSRIGRPGHRPGDARRGLSRAHRRHPPARHRRPRSEREGERHPGVERHAASRISRSRRTRRASRRSASSRTWTSRASPRSTAPSPGIAPSFGRTATSSATASTTARTARCR